MSGWSSANLATDELRAECERRGYSVVRRATFNGIVGRRLSEFQRGSLVSRGFDNDEGPRMVLVLDGRMVAARILRNEYLDIDYSNEAVFYDAALFPPTKKGADCDAH